MRGDRHPGDVGLTYVRVRLSKGPSGPARPVRVLVDTGASIAMIPRSILEALGVTPLRREDVELADGRLVPRDIGLVILRYEGIPYGADVIFGEGGDAALLGVITLEELGLTVDPRTGNLTRVRRMVIHARAAAPA